MPVLRSGDLACHDLPHCDGPVRRVGGKESWPAGPEPPQDTPRLRGQRDQCVAAGAGFPVRPVPGPRHPRDRGVNFLVDRHGITPASLRTPTPNRSSRYAPASRSGHCANPFEGKPRRPQDRAARQGRHLTPSLEMVPTIRMAPNRKVPGPWTRRDVRSGQCRVW